MTDLTLERSWSTLQTMNTANKTQAPESDSESDARVDSAASDDSKHKEMPREINGPKGLEPTRYGDWEVKGRCSDF